MSNRGTRYRLILCLIPVLLLSGITAGQDISVIALGDMHYDRLDLHDWDYVMTRPQDFRQIMNEYPQYTAVYMPAFISLIKEQIQTYHPEVKGVVQLGDLVEGVAGNEDLACQMNRGAIELLRHSGESVPWILVKGNHDVSNSPGQPEAWREVIRPFMEQQVKKPVDEGMYSYRLARHTELFILDQFFSDDRGCQEEEMVDWLEKKLDNSDAVLKVILTHQPVIPVTERCWHVLSGLRREVDDPTLRNRFLNILGRHKAIVLCAHLHKYSVLRRETGAGPIVQVMINSVNRGFDVPPPDTLEKVYMGSSFFDTNQPFQPSTEKIRREILLNEKQHISYFLRGDMPGYAILEITESTNTVILSYFNGFSKIPYHRINLSELQEHKE